MSGRCAVHVLQSPTGWQATWLLEPLATCCLCAAALLSVRRPKLHVRRWNVRHPAKNVLNLVPPRASANSLIFSSPRTRFDEEGGSGAGREEGGGGGGVRAGSCFDKSVAAQCCRNSPPAKSSWPCSVFFPFFWGGGSCIRQLLALFCSSSPGHTSHSLSLCV